MTKNTIPKHFRKGNKPSKYNDLDKNVKFICSIIKLISEKDCYIGGSYYQGIPALNSDIDIYVEEITQNLKNKIQELSLLVGIKIDLGIKGEWTKCFKIE